MSVNEFIILILGIIVLLGGIFDNGYILGFFAKHSLMYDLFGVKGLRISVIIFGLGLISIALTGMI